jgi:transcriptional regulator with XRE-family HTH domain
MRLKDAIGETLRELRKGKRMPLRELSSLSFVSIGHLSEIERSIKLATPDVLECLAFGLGMPTWKLLMEVAVKMGQDEGIEMPAELTRLLGREASNV